MAAIPIPKTWSDLRPCLGTAANNSGPANGNSNSLQYFEEHIDYSVKMLRGLQTMASSSQRRAGQCAAQVRKLKQRLRRLQEGKNGLPRVKPSKCAPPPTLLVAASVLQPRRVDARCSLRLEGPGVDVPGNVWTASLDLLDDQAEEAGALRYLIHLLLQREVRVDEAVSTNKKGEEELKQTQKQQRKASGKDKQARKSEKKTSEQTQLPRESTVAKEIPTDQKPHINQNGKDPLKKKAERAMPVPATSTSSSSVRDKDGRGPSTPRRVPATPQRGLAAQQRPPAATQGGRGGLSARQWASATTPSASAARPLTSSAAPQGLSASPQDVPAAQPLMPVSVASQRALADRNRAPATASTPQRPCAAPQDVPAARHGSSAAPKRPSTARQRSSAGTQRVPASGERASASQLLQRHGSQIPSSRYNDIHDLVFDYDDVFRDDLNDLVFDYDDVFRDDLNDLVFDYDDVFRNDFNDIVYDYDDVFG